MNLNPWILYLIFRLDTMHAACVAMLISWTLALIVGTIVSIVVLVDNEDKDRSNDRLKKCLKFFYLIMLVVLFLTSAAKIFLPTTKEAAAIIIIPKIVNNEQIQKDSSEIYKLAIDKIKEALLTEDQNN